ncbi:hypothetical protein BDZ89DRAFT_432374 [Hymenopellis radicata]|nr:hypothetical protein BDZ89DRAFT_432374 [Hymenopellis radicata]
MHSHRSLAECDCHGRASTSRWNAPPARILLDDLYKPLRDALWPADGWPGEVELAPDEPPALLKYVETLTPDDGWLNPSSEKSDSDAMDVDPSITDLDKGKTSEGEYPNADDDVNDPGGDDEGEGADPNDGEDVDDGPATIHYINLYTHKTLALLGLALELTDRSCTATFILRHEYSLFMRYAMRMVSKPNHKARFFVTGQPGIGKCFGCYYFLFRLLALGHDGVQKTEQIPQEWPAIKKAIKESWVLIDVDDKSQWSCPLIFNHARCVIWTSSPRQPRMNHFLKTFAAEPWYMKAWSLKEIAALTERYAIDHSEILEKLDAGGPVPRWLFGLGFAPTPATLEQWIREALLDNLFAFTPLNASGAAIQPVHRVFLVEPLVVIDKRGRACLQRSDYSAEFLSPYIAQKTADLAQYQLERVQGQLAAALNVSVTRSVARKVVEGLQKMPESTKLPLVCPLKSPCGRV